MLVCPLKRLDNTLTIQQQLLLACIEGGLIDSAIYQQIGETGTAVVEVLEPQGERRLEAFHVIGLCPVCLLHQVPQVPHLPLVHAEARDIAERNAFKVVATPRDAPAGTAMAAVIGMGFLVFAGEGTAGAVPALHHLAQEKLVLLGLRHRFAAQDALYPLKERLGDEWLMRAGEGLSGPMNADHARIKGVVEDYR